MIVASARDVDAAVHEIREWGKSRWAVAVMPLVTNAMPVDHPSLDPIWRAALDHDLPIVHHSFTWTPPYFPGYADLWDNIFLGRLASHPWGAMRFIAGVIGGGIMDRYATLRVGTLECGFGWLPFWGRRMDEQYAYVGSTADLKMKPSEYLTSGRFFCSIERQEGEDMFNTVTDFLGDGVLMYASDYPHSECQFPDSVDNVLAWKSLGSDTRDTAADCHLGGDCGAGANADVEMVVHLSADRSNATVMSIPRDTQVMLPKCTDTANHTRGERRRLRPPYRGRPRAAPLALLFQPRKNCFDVEVFRMQAWPQLVRQNRRRNRSLGKRPHRIRRGQWPPHRVLLHVNQHAPRGPFGHRPLVGHQVGMLRRYRARNDFSKRPQLLVGVNRLHRNKNVESRRARSFQKAHDPRLFQLFMQRSRNRNYYGKFRAIGRIQVEKEVVGVLQVVQRAGPGIVVNATKPRQEQE